jgi:hypothetical protein
MSNVHKMLQHEIEWLLPSLCAKNVVEWMVMLNGLFNSWMREW